MNSSRLNERRKIIIYRYISDRGTRVIGNERKQIGYLIWRMFTIGRIQRIITWDHVFMLDIASRVKFIKENHEIILHHTNKFFFFKTRIN